MKKRLVSTLITSVVLSSQVHADTIGVYLGGHIWDNQAKGEFGSKEQQIDFNLTDQQQGSYFVALEHPVPFLPNAKISSTTLATDGNTTLTSDFTYNNETFASGQQVNADFDVSYIDYTLYYELFDNDLLSFDFGLTARDFNGAVTLTSTVTGNSGTSTVSDSIATNSFVPLLYVATNIGLPFTGFNLFANGNFLSIGDHSLYDYQVGVSYELIDNLAIDVNIDAGYRAVKLTVNDLSDLYADVDFTGAFLGATIHF